ncbi:unnamed protein product [Medioppia subpectinata]|uniref:Ubiquitin-like-conjugating enzyme ATG10 n=1 Tax=Medioppia subpectinata TaxID=1979941 RepID=A0A7R9QL86_9ACAR|nr:unnamed protein product [Medioppia subpectinata]CAG2121975.1 unnamed protein product [Medioppia subpectinata]
MTKTEFKALPVVDKVSNVESLDTNVDPQEVNTPTETIAKFEYHIVYSISYSVPVLYFTVTKTDGSLVRIEDIWKWIPKSIYTPKQTSDASVVDMTDESALYRKYGSMLTQMNNLSLTFNEQY